MAWNVAFETYLIVSWLSEVKHILIGKWWGRINITGFGKITKILVMWISIGEETNWILSLNVSWKGSSVIGVSPGNIGRWGRSVICQFKEVKWTVFCIYMIIFTIEIQLLWICYSSTWSEIRVWVQQGRWSMSELVHHY